MIFRIHSIIIWTQMELLLMLYYFRHDGKPCLQTQHSSTFEFTVAIAFIKVKFLRPAHSSDIHPISAELWSHFLPTQETTESILKL